MILMRELLISSIEPIRAASWGESSVLMTVTDPALDPTEVEPGEFLPCCGCPAIGTGPWPACVRPDCFGCPFCWAPVGIWEFEWAGDGDALDAPFGGVDVKPCASPGVLNGADEVDVGRPMCCFGV